MPQVWSAVRVTVYMSGANQGVRNFEELKKGLKNKIVRKAVSAGVVPMTRAVKTTDRYTDRYGFLRRSTGSRVKTYRGSGVSVGVAGTKTRSVTYGILDPRRASTTRRFVRTAKIVNKGWDPATGRNAISIMERVRAVDPRKYTHLVELGHRNRGGGRVRGRHYLLDSFRRSQGMAKTRFNSKFQSEVGAVVYAMAKKGP